MSELRIPIKRVSQLLVITAVIGLIISLYLTYHHYAILADPTTQSFCDVSDVFNCSEVNSSAYAEFLNTPVALLGAIYFIAAILFSIKTLKDVQYYKHLTILHTLGLFSVFYLVYAEFILQTVCLFCSAVHIIIIGGLALSILGIQKTGQHISKEFLQSYHKKVMVYIIIGIIILGYNLALGEQSKGLPTSFAECLTEKGLVMYGSYLCPHCIAEKKLFGSSFKYIQYVECHPAGPNPDLERCGKIPVTSYPTWTVEINGTVTNKEIGYLSVGQLSFMSECEMPKE